MFKSFFKKQTTFTKINSIKLISIIILPILLSSCAKSANVIFGTSQIKTPAGMILVPAGKFLMGSNKEDTKHAAGNYGLVKPLYKDEHPLHEVKLPSYFIDIYETTNNDFLRFVVDTESQAPSSWKGKLYPSGEDNRPVAGVSWYQASRYCSWAGKRLPSEAEWEKSARGAADSREYPWGDKFDKKKANTGVSGIGHLTDAGSFEDGKSPYGTYDMSGNVWEWTSDWYQPYEGSSFESDKFGMKYKVLKGGSWGGVGHYSLKYFYRIPYRFYAELEFGYSDVGFRCAKSAD